MTKELWRYYGFENQPFLESTIDDLISKFGKKAGLYYRYESIYPDAGRHVFVKLGECDPVERRLADAYKKQGLSEVLEHLQPFDGVIRFEPLGTYNRARPQMRQELSIDPANGNDETMYVQISGRAQRGDNLGDPVKLSKEVWEAIQEDMLVHHKPWPSRPAAKAPDRMIFPPWGQPVAVEPPKPEQPCNASIPDDELVKLLPGHYYMDLPDGGSVTLLEQLQRMAKDAERWRALLNSARIRPLGSAGLGTNGIDAHIGLEMWTIFSTYGMPEDAKQRLRYSIELGRQWLTEYAEKSIAAIAERNKQ